jgi:hypothetical protein
VDPCKPLRKKLLYDVFKATETPDWERAYTFALPVIGLTNWSQLTTRVK